MHKLQIIGEEQVANSHVHFVGVDNDNAQSQGILKIGNQNVGFRWNGENPILFEIPQFELLAIQVDFSIIILSTKTGNLRFKIGIDFDFLTFIFEDYSLLVVTELRIVIINLNVLSVNNIISIPDIITNIDIVGTRILVTTLDGKYEKSLY